MPIVFMAIRPADADVAAFVPEADAPPPPADQSNSIARRMDRPPIGSMFLLAAGLAALFVLWFEGALTFDVNMVILGIMEQPPPDAGIPIKYQCVGGCVALEMIV